MDERSLLRVEEVRAATRLAAHEGPWRALHKRSSHGDCFNGYDWLSVWLSVHWRDQPISFRLAWSGTDLVGLMPLLDDVEGQLGCPGSLVSPVDKQVARMGPLMDDRTPGAIQAMLGIPQSDRRASPLIFKRLPVATGSLQALRVSSASLGLLTHDTLHNPSPVVELPDGLDAYWSGRSKHFRSEARRKRKIAVTTASARLRVASDPASVAKATSDVLAIERRSWKEPEGTSLTTEQGSHDLYSMVAKELAEDGSLRLFVLELNGRPSAYAFCCRVGDKLYALKTSYRSDDAQLSPGAVLFGYLVEYAAEHGYRTVELLGEVDEWKRRMATGMSEAVTLCLFPRSKLRCQGCHLLEGAVKPFMRDRLPGTVTSLKKARSLLTRSTDGDAST